MNVQRLAENICTCGAHPAAACACDSSRCNGGAAFVGDDGSLWIEYSVPATEAERAAILRYAGLPA